MKRKEKYGKSVDRNYRKVGEVRGSRETKVSGGRKYGEAEEGNDSNKVWVSNSGEVGDVRGGQ